MGKARQLGEVALRRGMEERETHLTNKKDIAAELSISLFSKDRMMLGSQSVGAPNCLSSRATPWYEARRCMKCLFCY